MKFTILILFISICVSGQDTIFFTNELESFDFSDSTNIENGYPRQNAAYYQIWDYDSVNSIYYQIINKVNKKAFDTLNTNWSENIYALVGRIYIYNSVSYQCIKSHKTKLTNIPPDTKYWSQDTPKDWILDEDVYVGQIRIYELISYKCIKDHKTKEDNKPPDTKYWELY